MTFGEKVKYVRELRGMSQTELSEKADISKPYLSEIENGKKRPSTKALERIAKVLEADAWFFLDDHAVTFEEVANVSKVNLSDELMTFVADQKNVPYIVLAKELGEEGIPPETLQKLLEIAKSLKK